MDVSQYLEIFLDETKEHLQSLNSQILELEQDSENMETINEIFRAAHSIKGMAGTMGYKRMQLLTHHMENVFSEVRNGEIKVKANMIDILFQCLDALEEYVTNIQNLSEEGSNDNEVLIKILNEILEEKNIDTKEEVNVCAVETSIIGVEDVEGQNIKWGAMKFSETERSMVEEAKETGNTIYGITIKVQDTCVLKAARAFLVLKAVEAVSEIITSNPCTQDIEDEKFDLEFELIITTEIPIEEILGVIMNVSEIEDAVGEEIDLFGTLENEQNQENKEKTQQEIIKQEKINKNKVEQSKAGGEKKKQKTKAVANRTVRVDIEKLDVLMNLVSELIIAKNSLVATTGTEDIESTGFHEQIEYLESVTTNLHESVMKVRMVPIESVVNKFPRMIRDLSKKLDKRMELFMSGEETELDRTVVDEIGDPLMHLLRNSADHGLESAEVRRERGKPEIGTINLSAFQDGNNVVIEVEDDGNGIDVDVIKRKAIERGTITEEQSENMEDKDIIDLLFLPSFSTAKVVSDVSGRGVGLDVVRSKIEALSGEVEIKTKLGVGSTFTIRLPLTLAIIQALMVTVGNEKYAISLGSIQTIEDIKPENIKLVESKEVINLRGCVIPLVRLSKALDIASNKEEEDNIIVVIIKKGDKLAGIVVDDLTGQQEIVIKSLGKHINKCKMISGATILGDGEVALILDTNSIV